MHGTGPVTTCLLVPRRRRLLADPGSVSSTRASRRTLNIEGRVAELPTKLEDAPESTRPGNQTALIGLGRSLMRSSRPSPISLKMRMKGALHAKTSVGHEAMVALLEERGVE